MRPDDFSVGWICALDHELAASMAMLDELYQTPGPLAPQNENVYTAGRIGNHNVIMACLPAGRYGTNSAATVAKDMTWSFPNLRFGLLVGIGAGVPTPVNDIRLGDVVVSIPTQTHGGVIQYDLGKILPGGAFKRKGTLASPPRKLLSAVQNLRSLHRSLGSSVGKYLQQMLAKMSDHTEFAKPAASSDQLFSGDNLLLRRDRLDPFPKIHYGLIASGDKVIASAEERDRLRAEDDIICFEMEAAGLMDSIRCLVIRGICDYADAHKNDDWQNYAAASAAAYAKELLMSIPADDASQHDQPSDQSMLLDAPDQDEVKSFASTSRTATDSQSFSFLSRKTTSQEDEPGAPSKYALPFSYQGVRPVNEFVGRLDDMRALEDFFRPTKLDLTERKVFTIHGMGGIGKTQLCLNYMRMHKDHYSAILWIDGSSDEAARRSFRSISSRLPNSPSQSPPGASDSASVHQVTAWLSLRDNYRWLLIFDNVDMDFRAENPDPQAFDVETYFPPADHGSVLITSRLDAFHDIGVVRHLQGFDAKLSKEILESRIGKRLHDASDVAETIERLQGLPLALTLAGSLIRDTGRTFATYNNEYDDQWESLLHRQDRRPLREYDRRMLTTWLVSYNQVQNESEPATRLFELWAFLSNSALKFSLFEPIASGRDDVYAWPSWIKALAQNKADFYDAMAHLTRFSLATQAAGEPETYSMHPVIHDWCFSMILSRAGGAACKRTLELASAIVSCHADTGQEWKYDWPLFRSLLPHCRQICRRFAKTVAHADDLDHCDSATLHLFNFIAFLLSLVGKPAEAAIIYERTLQGQEKLLGPDHWATNKTVMNLGNIYIDQKKLPQAESMLLRAARAREDFFGPGSPEGLRAISNLAALYEEQGRLAESQAMYDRVLAGREARLGASHPQTLKTVNNIGLLYLKRGKLAQAEAMLSRARDANEAQLGAQHPSTLDTVSILGILYQRQGRPADAEAAYRRALAGQQATLGPEHYMTLETTFNLGIFYFRQSRLADAEALYVRALRGHESVVGREHQSTLKVVRNLVQLYDLQGATARSDALRERYLKGRKR